MSLVPDTTALTVVLDRQFSSPTACAACTYSTYVVSRSRHSVIQAVAILGSSEPVLLPPQEETLLRSLHRSAQERLSYLLAGSGAPLHKQLHIP